MDTLSIAELTLDDIRRIVREATAPALDSARLADFVASVDWAGLDTASVSVREMLGQIEAWGVEYAEGDLSASDYREALTGLLATPAR